MTNEEFCWNETLFKGFSCPQEFLSPELIELVVVEHAREVCRAFLDKHATLLDVESKGLVCAITDWTMRPASFDAAWTLGIGALRAAMRPGGEPDSLLAAAQFGFDLLNQGTPGSWEVRLRHAARLRWGNLLFPLTEDLSVKSDGTQAVVRLRNNRREHCLTLRHSPSGWRTVNADQSLSAHLGKRPISLFVSDALDGRMNDDLRPRVIKNLDLEMIRATVEAAANILSTLTPQYEMWTSRVLRGIVPFQMVDDMYLSGSNADRPGVITCSFPTPPEMLCELLVHEASHQYYFMLNRLGSLDDGSDKRLYYSPARRLDRPLSYILLAYHAVGNMLLFWRSCLASDSSLPKHCFDREKELTEWASQLEPPLRNTSAFTALGQCLWKPLGQQLQ